MRGRRPGNQDTRGKILEEARELFIAQGYAKTSMRGIARAAGVDPSLVHHYFECKSKLYSETSLHGRSGFIPEDLPQEILDASTPETVGSVLVEKLVEAWEDPDAVNNVRANLRFLGENPVMTSSLEGAIRSVVVEELGDYLAEDHRELRVSLLISQMMGVALSRYVFHEESCLAGLSPRETAELVGPTVQHYLRGRLDSPRPE